MAQFTREGKTYTLRKASINDISEATKYIIGQRISAVGNGASPDVVGAIAGQPVDGLAWLWTREGCAWLMRRCLTPILPNSTMIDEMVLSDDPILQVWLNESFPFVLKSAGSKK